MWRPDVENRALCAMLGATVDGRQQRARQMVSRENAMPGDHQGVQQ
jgi:hypothetical protein